MKLNKKDQTCSIVKVNNDGSIILPKEVMSEFKINVGDEVMLMGEKGKGIAIVKNDLLLKMMKLKK